jgi:hypothetical protein
MLTSSLSGRASRLQPGQEEPTNTPRWQGLVWDVCRWWYGTRVWVWLHSPCPSRTRNLHSKHGWRRWPSLCTTPVPWGVSSHAGVRVEQWATRRLGGEVATAGPAQAAITDSLPSRCQGPDGWIGAGAPSYPQAAQLIKSGNKAGVAPQSVDNRSESMLDPRTQQSDICRNLHAVS